MKTKHLLDRKEGGVLITVLMITTVMSVTIASILNIVSQEYVLSKRNLAWNQAIYTAEAGVEFGWNELNKLTGVNSTNGTPFLSANGWTTVSSTNWMMNRSITNAVASGAEQISQFVVHVYMGSMTSIVVYATNSSPGIDRVVTRNLKAVLKPVTPFNNAILTKGLLDFNGNSAQLDSWNSNTGGDYDIGDRRAHGNIATDGTVIDAGGLDLYGSPSTGPGGTWAADIIQPVSPDTGTNYYTSDTQISIPDASLPSGVTFPAATAPTDVSVAGNYTFTGLGARTFGSATGNGGTIRVYVTGSFSLGGSSDLDIIQPTDTTKPRYQIELYVAGSISFSGTVDVNTEPGARAANLQVYGLPTCTSVTISGNSKVQACIYAPNATVDMNGGGSEAFYGSIVGNTLQGNGGINYHYDEALAGVGTITGFTIAQWIEF